MFSFENEKKINISNNHWCNHLLHSWCHCGSDHPNISQYLVPDFKKLFTPPSWLFAPVWTLLYLLMGIALGRVWYYGIQQSHVKKAVYLFGFQLLFNGLWSLIFFGLKNPIGGLVVIVALFLIIRTVQQFKTVELFASRLLYPYLIWICFAFLLNGGIVFLNYL